jgi:hypothetical protein
MLYMIWPVIKTIWILIIIAYFGAMAVVLLPLASLALPFLTAGAHGNIFFYHRLVFAWISQHPPAQKGAIAFFTLSLLSLQASRAKIR